MELNSNVDQTYELLTEILSSLCTIAPFYGKRLGTSQHWYSIYYNLFQLTCYNMDYYILNPLQSRVYV